MSKETEEYCFVNLDEYLTRGVFDIQEYQERVIDGMCESPEGNNLEIRLFGIKIDYVSLADARTGYLVHYLKDKRGDFYIWTDSDGYPMAASEILCGDVEFYLNGEKVEIEE